MTAPIGATVRIYVDLVARVADGDLVETTGGRRYRVLGVRVQQHGKHAGRQHLTVLVVPPDTRAACTGVVRTAPANVECLSCGAAGQHCDRRLHRIRWYPRSKRAR